MLIKSVKLGASLLKSRAGSSGKFKSKRVQLRKPQIGASGIEYAVIAGLVVVALVGAFTILDLDGLFTNLASELSGIFEEEAVDP